MAGPLALSFPENPMTTYAKRSRIEIQFLGQVQVHAETGSTVINDKKAILLMFVLAVRGATSRQQMA